MITTGTYLSNKKAKPKLTPTICTAVIASELAYVDIITVKVEGVTFDIIRSGLPGNRQVLSQTTGGGLFNPTGVLYFDISLGTKNVFVMYQ